MSIKKAVIFDLDGTLIPLNESLICQIKDRFAYIISKKRGVSIQEAYRILEETIVKTFEDDIYLRYRKAALNFVSPKEAVDQFYELEETPAPFDAVIYRALKKIREKGYFIIVVSNSKKERVTERLREAKILDFVDYIESSSELLAINAPSPKLEKYRAVLNKFGLSPKNVYVVGDCYNLDLAPASLLGLKTILVLHDKSVVEKAVNRAEFEKLVDFIN